VKLKEITKCKSSKSYIFIKRKSIVINTIKTKNILEFAGKLWICHLLFGDIKRKQKKLVAKLI